MARKNPIVPVVSSVVAAETSAPTAVAETSAPTVAVETSTPAPEAEVVDNLWLFRGLEWQAAKFGVTLPVVSVTDEDRSQAAAIVATWEAKRLDKIRRAQAGEEVKGELRQEPFGSSTLRNAERQAALRRHFDAAGVSEAEIRAARKAPTAASFRRHLGLEVAKATTRSATPAPAPAAKVGSTTGAVAARRGTQAPAPAPASGSPAVGGLAALDLLLAQGVITADQHTAGMRALLSA